MTPTIGEALDVLAARDPDAPAVDDGRTSLDRAALARASRAAAHGLLAAGVRADDLVAVRMANDAESVAAVCGVWRAGATPVPVRAAADPGQLAALLAAVRPRVVLDPHDVDLTADGDPLPPAAAASWKAQPTGGSTGAPKVVLSAVPARVDPDRQVAAFLPVSARQLVSGPLGAAAAFTYAMRGLTTGHALVLLPRFDAADVLSAIGRHRITWALLPPAMLHRLDRDPHVDAADLASLEQVVHLGSSIDPALKRRWLARLGPERMTEVYAGTESNGVLSIRGDEWLQHPGSVGRAAGGTEVRVVDASGAPVPPGVVGRVELRRTGGVAYRYLGRPAPRAGAWDTLGDAGRLDADGYLTLVDRAGDLVVRDGTIVAPAAVEQALQRHPAVRSAVAVGVQGRIHAVVDVAGDPIGVPELLAWVRTHADPAPDSVEIVHEPLRDDAGKARRSALVPHRSDDARRSSTAP